MERTVSPLRRLHATSVAIALLASSFTPALQAAPRKTAPAATTSADDAAVPTSRARSQMVTLNFVNADIDAVSR